MAESAPTSPVRAPSADAQIPVARQSADLTQLPPTDLHADLVVLLVDGKPVLGIVVGVQLQRDDRKKFTWALYMAALRARLECPTCVLVVTPRRRRTLGERSCLAGVDFPEFSRWSLAPARTSSARPCTRASTRANATTSSTSRATESMPSSKTADSTRPERSRELEGDYPDEPVGTECLASVYEARGLNQAAAELYRRAAGMQLRGEGNFCECCHERMLELAQRLDYAPSASLLTRPEPPVAGYVATRDSQRGG